MTRRRKWITLALVAALAVAMTTVALDAQTIFRVVPGTKFDGDIKVTDDATFDDAVTITGALTANGGVTLGAGQVLNVPSTATLTAADVTSLAISARDTVASTGTLRLGSYSSFRITGTADIDSFDTNSGLPDGAIAILEFAGTAANYGLNDSLTLKLSGDLGYTPDDIVVVHRVGNNLLEMSRGAN